MRALIPSKTWFIVAVLGVTSGCGSPSLDGTTFSCATDADCLGGKICGMANGVHACVDADSNPIRVGMSAPLQGPSQDLGIEMRRGIEAMFKSVNDAGGVLGRSVELTSMNDN